VLALLGNNQFTISTAVGVPDLTDGANYMFSVRAKNALGFGSFSSSITIMAASPPGKPIKPTILSASQVSISI
jgi:hypothetical protein